MLSFQMLAMSKKKDIRKLDMLHSNRYSHHIVLPGEIDITLELGNCEYHKLQVQCISFPVCVMSRVIISILSTTCVLGQEKMKSF